jgi:UDP-N-acetyl-D-glucosamine dehydrogenase
MPPTATQLKTSAAPLDQPVPATVPSHAPAPPAADPALGTVAVLGMGYVGLPTGLALASAGFGVIGIDVSEHRLETISSGAADLLPRDRERLEDVALEGRLRLTTDSRALAAADTVVICVPTPVDERLEPDLRFLRDACAAVVLNARPGQLILLTSTSYVGTTRDLLIEPLAGRGLLAGEDVFVAFSPERIDPGNARHRQEDVPRVVGGASERCARRAADVVGRIAQRAHRVSSPEAAELSKLYENSFRAVNIGFANEMADATLRLGLDPIEVTEAAATKPYGYMPFYPGAGVGGHCIPCDPHYLLGGLRDVQASAPILERAMSQIAARPGGVVRRAQELLERGGSSAAEARVLVVGAAYKPGIMDTRESPAMEILHGLLDLGAEVGYHDPLVRSLELGDGLTLLATKSPKPRDYDLVIVVTTHAGHDYEWLRRCPHVLDCTYRTPGGLRRSLI